MASLDDFARLLKPGAHWAFTRKYELVRAIALGEVEREAAKARLGISEDEMASLQRRYRTHGVEGLKLTRTQALR